jgi:hypothetical protein
MSVPAQLHVYTMEGVGAGELVEARARLFAAQWQYQHCGATPGDRRPRNIAIGSRLQSLRMIS